MEDTLEQFGLALLEMAAGAAALAVLYVFLRGEGEFVFVIRQYLSGICG